MRPTTAIKEFGPDSRLLPRVFGLLCCLWALLVLFRVLPWVGEVEYIPDFQGPSVAREANQISALPTMLSPDARIDLSLEFRLDQAALERLADQGHHYAGLFQTADGERGIRIEMGVSRSQYTNWGLSVAGQHYDLGRMPTANRWHSLRLVTEGRSLTLTLDGVRAIQLTDRPETVLIDTLRAGYGYTPDRLFPGQIRNFLVILQPYDTELAALQQHLFILLLVVLLLWLASTTLTAPNIRSAALDSAPARWLWVLIYFGGYFWLKSHYAKEINGELLSDIALICAMWIALLSALALSRRRLLRQAVLGSAILANYGIYATLMIGATYFRNRATGSEYGLTFDEIGALHQSNALEAIEFFLSNFTPLEQTWILLFPAVPSLMLYLLTRVRLPRWSLTWSIHIGISALALVPFMLSAKSGITATIVGGWQSYAEAQRNFSEYRMRRAQAPATLATKRETGETYVLVIGESSNRDHYSAYGYFRPTTPWLDQQLIARNGVFFTNAYASYAHTVPALLQALTASNQYNRQSSLTSPTLIEVFRAAGFHTTWLSEQTMSWADTPLHTIAAEADQTVHVRSPGKIVPRFREILKTLDRTRNNLIVVHMMGSHADYRNRYPASFTFDFSRAQEDIGDHSRATEFLDRFLDPYDKSIRYTDHQLAEMATALDETRLGRHALIFASDHGEDVWKQRFHDATNFSFPMVRIPLVMRYSADWIDRYQVKHERLQQHKDYPFTLDLLFDTMIGVAGIETSAATAEFDLSHARYHLNEKTAVVMRPPPDLLSGVYAHIGERTVRDDPQLIATRNMRALNKDYPERFLANWSDSLARTAEADALEFSGIEVNVAVPSLHIGHYPEIVHTRTLAQYLALPTVRNKKKLWLDLKLETGHTLNESLTALESLDKQFGLKARAIIESPEQGLATFAENGWHTSYYFIPERWPGCFNDDNARRQCAKELAFLVKEQRLGAVSFDLRYYPFINRYVTPLLPPSVVFHTFGAELPSIFLPNFRDQLFARIEMRDRRISSILIEGSQTIREGRH